MSDIEEHRIELSQYDLDHLNDGQPIHKGIGEDIRLELYSDAPLKAGESGESDEEPPLLEDVVNMELEHERERKWMVLYDEDYDDVLIDTEDSVALLVDNNQAVEILRLASQIIGSLAPEQAPDKEPIRAMIDALEAEAETDD